MQRFPSSCRVQFTPVRREKRGAMGAFGLARPCDHTAPTLPFGKSPFRPPRAKRFSLPGEVAPKSSPACRRTTPVQMSFGQQEPVIPRVLDQPTARLHQLMLQLVSDQLLILCGSPSRRHRLPRL